MTVSAALRAPYTVIIAAKPVRFNLRIGSERNEECSQMPVRTRGSASSRMTAATPPMNSETGFLKTRHEMESGGTRANSPRGVAKSNAGESSGWNKARAAESTRRCTSIGSGNGEGKTRPIIGRRSIRQQEEQC